ncbi:MAG: hypothetical protein Q9170_001942 [Blastenia crenularia]
MAPSLPKTFKAAVWKKANDKLTIEDVELKEPEQGQILVKVLANGVCHTDAMVQSGALGNSFPIIPGHELVGNVVAVASGEKKWKVGDRVGGAWHGGHDGNTSKPGKGSEVTDTSHQVSAKHATVACSRCAVMRPSMASTEMAGVS